MPEFRYDVFISFNSADRAWAQSLAKRLRRTRYVREHFRVFLDEWEIRAGESIPKKISEALQSSERILMVLTPEWVRSEWCQLESEVAVYDDPGAVKQRAIPLLRRN